MFSLLNFLLGLLSGILTTLVAGNPYVRFHTEKFIRNRLRKPLVSASPRTISVYCKHGMLFLHCIELTNRMWLTPVIPRVFCNAPTTLNWYEPCQYFFDSTFKYFKNGTLDEVVKGYRDCVMAYTSDDSKRRSDIFKHTPKRVVVIVEPVNLEEKEGKDTPLNHIKKVGELHLGSRNLMPVLPSGYEWNMAIISEEFGLIDTIHLRIPANIEERWPLRDSHDVLKMKERPLTLMDVGVVNLTWPLRLEIQDSRFKTTYLQWMR